MTFRKIVFELHKILGLITGLVVFIVAITGCLWVFKEEIESLYDDYKQVPAEPGAMISPTRAKEVAEAVFPGQTIHGVQYKGPEEAVEVIFYDLEPEFYQSIFLNPYSGEILQVRDHLSGFFAFVLKGHTRLWLPREIGEEVVGISILMFLVLLISGAILWLPKKRKNLKQRLTFAWKPSTGWKRKNVDLHMITGFYIGTLAFLIAFTGSVMSYEWLQQAVHSAAGGEKDIMFTIPDSKAGPESPMQGEPIDQLLVQLQGENPNAESIELHFPYSEQAAIYVEVSDTEGIYYKNDYRFFDRFTLEEMESPSLYGTYAEASGADMLLRMNYDIHVGAIGGLPGKIIAFMVSFLVASLPVTGVLLWYGRTYKKKRKKEIAFSY